MEIILNMQNLARKKYEQKIFIIEIREINLIEAKV